MRILIDECVDPRVKLLFAHHTPVTVHEQGWDSIEDGRLLELAQDEFDVLLTADRSLEFQQNIPKFRIGVVVVQVPKNQFAYYQALKSELVQAIETASLVESFTLDESLTSPPHAPHPPPTDAPSHSSNNTR